MAERYRPAGGTLTNGYRNPSRHSGLRHQQRDEDRHRDAGSQRSDRHRHRAHRQHRHHRLPTDNNADGLGTYTLAETAVKASSADTLKLWIRDARIGSATSTVFTHAPGTSSGGGLGVLKITGMFPAGSLAELKSGKQDNASAGTPAVPLGSAGLTGNPKIGAVFNATSVAGMTKPTTFDTERFDVG